MVNKSEVYKSLIRIQKESGQGLSGIVKVMGDNSSKYRQYLDELIKEGLVKACHTGGSLGDIESNIFYMPTKGYNVWEDEGTDGQYNRHKGRYLHFVRLYLGLVKKVSESNFEPSLIDYLQNSELMKDYTEWLNRNQVALKEMLSLDDFYQEESIVLTDAETNWVKSRGWYKKDKLVSDCLKLSTDNDDTEMLSLNRKLIDLYKQSEKSNPGKYTDKLKESEEEIKRIQLESDYRRRVNSWLSTQDQSINIKSVI